MFREMLPLRSRGDVDFPYTFHTFVAATFSAEAPCEFDCSQHARGKTCLLYGRLEYTVVLHADGQTHPGAYKDTGVST